MFSLGAYGIGGLRQLSKMGEIERAGSASNPAAVAKLREVSAKVVLVGAILDVGGGGLCLIAAVLIHPVQVIPLSAETGYVFYAVGAVSLAGGGVTWVATLFVRRRQEKYRGPDPEVVLTPNIRYTGPVIERTVRVEVPGPVIQKRMERRIDVPGPIVDRWEYHDQDGNIWAKPRVGAY